MSRVLVTPGHGSLADWRGVRDGAAFALADGWRAGVQAAVDALAARLDRGDTMYGVNTGFGKLASTRIPPLDLARLQLNLVRSHAAGVGAPLPAPVVRLVLALKAASLARGVSGVRPHVIEALVRMLNAGALPAIPAQGSVGASGDLAPLAHMSLALIGEGALLDGAALPVPPVALGPKEGLALLNGTQVSTALALDGLFRAQDLLATALVAGALSVDAARGADTPFDPRIHAVRGQKGQIEAARVLAGLMRGSSIRDSHREGDVRVQDPYSLRCQPQVMGACLDLLRNAGNALGIEANAVSDNPLVFAEDGAVLSGGNFHAQPVAFAADTIALVLAEIGSLSERRIALLTDPALSGLPAFLVEDGGRNSGFMIAQVTAAALASENVALAAPRSVLSLPTSANQEDHVSMATNAALRLAAMADNLAAILAVELLAASQGIHLLRPLRSSDALEEAMTILREAAAPWEEDRYMAADIEAVTAQVRAGRYVGFAA